MRTDRPTAQERAMRMREVLLKAMSGELTWIQAAEILDVSARTMRRWKRRWEKTGFDGLIDRRRRSPSLRQAAPEILQHMLRLYRRKYRGFNMRHFHSIMKRKHGYPYSYTLTRVALQEAGLVKKKRPRGPHRRRRDPREHFGEMLHLDGSLHAWLALRPQEKSCLIVVLDDATKRILYAQLVERESTRTVMAALGAVLEVHGVPMSLYTDRAGWAVYTPKKGEPFDPKRPTQFARALRRLGIEHILGYSPQARGRSERANGTFQGRLVNELRVARIATLEAANRYLRASFIPDYNDEFSLASADPASAFVPLGGADLRQILCREETRTVARDNTVSLGGVRLQIEKQKGRATCAGLEVIVRRHLDYSYSVWRGHREIARFDSKGRTLRQDSPGTTGRIVLPSVAA